MTRAVFVSYRRGPTGPWAGRLADRFRSHLGDSVVFLDVDSIPAGADFTETIEARLASVDTVIALIGPDWFGVDATTGARRIDDPEDFVRREVATALRQGHRVIPVLVDGANMPTRDDLPEEMRPLVTRNAVVVTHDAFAPTVDALIAQIDPDQAGGSSTQRRLPTWAIGAAAILLVAIAAVVVVILVSGPDDDVLTAEPATTVSIAPTTPTTTTTMPIEPGSAELVGVIDVLTSAGRSYAPSSGINLDALEVQVTGDDEAAARFATVDVDGAFRIDGLTPGEQYDVVVIGVGYGSVRQSIQADVDPVELSLEVRAASGAVSGIVVDSDGVPIGRARVTATNTFGVERSTVTATEGDLGGFRFDDLETPATYNLEVSADGYESQVLNVSVRPGALVSMLSVQLAAS